MRRFQQIAPGVGLLLFGCLTATAVVQGCQPGKICDKDEYAEQCANPLGGSGGGGSGGGGSSGSGGGGSGGGGSGGGTAVTRDTPVMDCPEFNTLGAADNFFGRRCGHEQLCHTGSGANAWSDLKMENVFMRMLNTNTKNVCTGLPAADKKMIDGANWQNSIILVKTRDDMPKCKNGSAAGTIMPAPEAMQAAAMKQPPLSAAEKKCIENFIKAATGN